MLGFWFRLGRRFGLRNKLIIYLQKYISCNLEFEVDVRTTGTYVPNPVLASVVVSKDKRKLGLGWRSHPEYSYIFSNVPLITVTIGLFLEFTKPPNLIYSNHLPPLSLCAIFPNAWFQLPEFFPRRLSSESPSGGCELGISLITAIRH